MSISRVNNLIDILDGKKPVKPTPKPKPVKPTHIYISAKDIHLSSTITLSQQEFLVHRYIRTHSKPYHVPNEIIQLCLLWFVPIKTVERTLKSRTFTMFEHLELTKRILDFYGQNKIVQVKDKNSDKVYALKKYTRYTNHYSDYKQTLQEIKLLKHLNHLNVIELVDVIPLKQYTNNLTDIIHILMPAMDTNIQRVITSKQVLTERHSQYIIYQTLRGLDYIHRCGVVHGSMKPKHILINCSNCRVRVTGLDNAFRMNSIYYDQEHMTNCYAAPEYELIGPGFLIDIHLINEQLELLQWSYSICNSANS